MQQQGLSRLCIEGNLDRHYHMVFGKFDLSEVIPEGSKELCAGYSISSIEEDNG